jgi:hypothetical protein
MQKDCESILQNHFKMKILNQILNIDASRKNR